LANYLHNKKEVGMDRETVWHIGDIFRWLVEHWQLSTLVIGGAFWGAVWSVKKVFPTHKVMEDCEKSMRVDLKKHADAEIARFKEFNKTNERQHNAINSRLDRIIDHLIKGNHE